MLLYLNCASSWHKIPPSKFRGVITKCTTRVFPELKLGEYRCRIVQYCPNCINQTILWQSHRRSHSKEKSPLTSRAVWEGNIVDGWILSYEFKATIVKNPQYSCLTIICLKMWDESLQRHEKQRTECLEGSILGTYTNKAWSQCR